MSRAVNAASCDIAGADGDANANAEAKAPPETPAARLRIPPYFGYAAAPSAAATASATTRHAAFIARDAAARSGAPAGRRLSTDDATSMTSAMTSAHARSYFDTWCWLSRGVRLSAGGTWSPARGG